MNGRNLSETIVDQAAERVELIIWKIQGEQVVDLSDAGPRIENRLMLADLLDARLFRQIILILDLTDDLLKEVFNRNQAGGAAILVNNQRHVHAALLQLLQQLVDLLGFWHEIGRAG